MPRKPTWQNLLSWRLEYAGYRLMEGVLRLLPIRLVDHLGSLAGGLFYYSSRRYRALALRNLRIAYGNEKTLATLQKLARKTCQRTIANFLGTLKTTILPTEKVIPQVSLAGEKALFEDIKRGRGAILVLGHMGNWEILNRLHHYLPAGQKAGGIYQPLKNPFVNRLLLRRRKQDGSRLFSKKDGFHAPATFVREGGLLIVVADQKAGRSGMACPFFDRLSSLSPLPAILAKKAKAPVYAAGIETIAAGRWRVTIEPLGIAPETRDIIACLQTLITRSPADYLWLHNRWRLDGRTPLSLRCRPTKGAPAPETTLATKPLRFLILTNQAPDDNALRNFLEQRLPNELPLAPEFLELIALEKNPVSSFFPHHTSTATTTEQLAAHIQTIDHSEPLPLELLVVLDCAHPKPAIAAAARLAQIPRVVFNPNGKTLGELLESLSLATRQP